MRAELIRMPRLLNHYLRSALLHTHPVVWDLNIVMTNRCNQACPMCNAGISNQDFAQVMSIDSFGRYRQALSGMSILVGTFSGGEPTLTPDLPEILTDAKQFFQERVMLISNFYTRGALFQRAMRAALATNAHIVCSFDGFGAVADQLRGSNDVARIVVDNIRAVDEMALRMKSSSALELHTVLSDRNLDQLDNILNFSARLGWAQTIAPVNPPESQKWTGSTALTPSRKLERAIDVALRAPNIRQLGAYIAGIPAYASRQHRKHCPYMTRGLETFKVFLEPNGDVSLCDRRPIGNLNTACLADILRGHAYEEFLHRAARCSGCWLSCFTEPVLGLSPSNIADTVTKRLWPRPIKPTWPMGPNIPAKAGGETW